MKFHFRPGRSHRRIPLSRERGPLSRRTGNGQLSPKVGVIFGLFFILPGLAVSWFAGVKPILKTQDAKSWVEAPARVLSSEVRTHRGSDSTTYSIRIAYSYVWHGDGLESEGRTYESDRYDFSSGSSSGYDGKVRIVKMYPKGHSFKVFVNPRNPSEAVINRELRPIYLVLTGFGLIFVLAGGAVLVASLRGGSPKASPRVAPTGGSSPPGSESLLLKPETKPWAKVIGMLFVCLFWNGIVGVFVFQLRESWLRGRPEYFPMIFMIPFVLIGLGLILGFFYSVLAAFNPRVFVLLTPGNPRLGAPFALDWEFFGASARIHELTITLEGLEKATYRQGTNTRTDEHVFYRKRLVSQEERTGIQPETLWITLPTDCMHSFAADNNKILWRFKVHGKIRRWPDLRADYPFHLEPPA